MKFFQRKKKIVQNNFICPKKWDELEGTEQVRFCTGCQTKVYDLRGLSEEEAIQFIEVEDGKLCALASYDRNGLIYNGNCKEGIQEMLGSVCTVSLPPEVELEYKISNAEQRVRNLRAMQKIIINKKS